MVFAKNSRILFFPPAREANILCYTVTLLHFIYINVFAGALGGLLSKNSVTKISGVLLHL